MKTETLSIEYLNGAKRDVSSLDEAREILSAQYETVIECENGWEPAGPNRERLLIWDNESEAEEDDGVNAVAQIIRTSTPQPDEN